MSAIAILCALIVISTHEISLPLPVLYAVTESHFRLGIVHKKITAAKSGASRVAKLLQIDRERSPDWLRWQRRVITTIKTNYGNYFYAYLKHDKCPKHVELSGRMEQRERRRERE